MFIFNVGVRFVPGFRKRLSREQAEGQVRVPCHRRRIFVLIPAGTFMMGSPPDEKGRGNDEVRHQVMITKPFYIQATEVTQGQWKKVMGKNPSKFDQCGDNCPVEMVSFNDVQEFIKILNLAEGTDKYRLPTEAEWEYAARAGGTGPFGLIGASRLNSAELEDRQFKNSVQKYLKMGDMPPLPEESRKYLVQAMDAFEMKNLQRSADLYNRVLETAPWWADGHRDRALILSELGMYKEAVIEMNRYIFLDPDASDARISQDRSYMWEGRIDSLPEGQSPGVNNEALIDKLCWHHGNSGAKTQPAAMKSPNRWGLYDMHGNVWEWCADWYGPYSSGKLTDPAGPSFGSLKVLRGGSWHSSAGYCRAAVRHRRSPAYRKNNIGFRLVRMP